MATSTILVTGATGQQGSATIDALVAAAKASSAQIKILALTRSIKSPKASNLVEKYGAAVTLVQGSPNDPEPILTAHPDITSIFLVTVPPDEEAQALPLIDAAVAHGIGHIVFTSVDRGGEEKSWGYETPVPHFAAKCRIENHLRNACAAKQNSDGAPVTQWTILRPTGFMDNYAPGTSFGKMMWTLWATMPKDRKMQLISTHDIGFVAANALLAGRDTPWAGRVVGLAGDDISFEDAEAAFRRVVGHEPPRMWNVVGSGIRWAINEAGTSMKWFEEVGFGVDVEEARREEPRLVDFETWLRTNFTGKQDVDAREG